MTESRRIDPWLLIKALTDAGLIEHGPDPYQRAKEVLQQLQQQESDPRLDMLAERFAQMYADWEDYNSAMHWHHPEECGPLDWRCFARVAIQVLEEQRR